MLQENVQLEKERDSLRKQFAKLTEEHESLREHMHSEHNKMTQEQKVHRQVNAFNHHAQVFLSPVKTIKMTTIEASPSIMNSLYKATSIAWYFVKQRPI